MRDELTKEGIFGKAIAWIWCIEYQKRGLPHMHLLLFLENRDRYLLPEIVDEIVSVQILPDSIWASLACGERKSACH